MSSADTVPLKCPSCGADTGAEMIEDRGAVYLDTGAWVVPKAKRHCYRCGRTIHFRPPSVEQFRSLLDSNGNVS